MKKIIYIAAVLSLLVSTNQVSAQLVIRNNGHAEIGTNPNANDALPCISICCPNKLTV